MAKVLRLHNGDDTIVDWQNSVPIGPDSIHEIMDPEDGNTKKEITSIPSPFARIDLVKTAFSQIVDNPKFDLDGKKSAGGTPSIYHKLVSDSLDVGEIFFNYNKLKDKIQIIIWDKEKDINDLINSFNPSHKTLGETLKMYFEQDSHPDLFEDSQMYNFNKLKYVYLLNYIGPGKMAGMNIIGATSPCTLFFSSANKLEFATRNISFDGIDRPFDEEYRPLYKRDFEYIKYLWASKKSDPLFVQYFSSFNKYLDRTYEKLSDDKKKILDSIDNKSIKDYKTVDISPEHYVEILDFPLHVRPSKELISSDFEIETSIYTNKKPLVLPIDSGIRYSSLTYTQGEWGKNNKAPICDRAPWKERDLPFVGDRYPYLTISDFLEDSIVKMPYQLNNRVFFDGNLSNRSSEIASYLLPLSTLFFEFFSVDELRGKFPDGKDRIEMKENAGGVTVTLRIPIKGDKTVKYIEYQRSYFDNNIPDLNKNNGALCQKKFGLGIFPPIKFEKSGKPHYRIALFDKEGSMSLNFYNETTEIDVEDKVIRREKDKVCSVESYVIDKSIDRIIANFQGIKGVILPILKSKSGPSQFTFAIDFGTTNTHIEYSKDGTPSKSFDIVSEEKQMQRMHLDYMSDKDIHYAFDDYFIPDSIGGDQLYKFPIRTTFAEWNKIDYTMPVYTLASGNIPFRYEKAGTPSHNNIQTELKWSIKRKKQVELFIENIFLLLRNKVLLDGGDLSATKIVWFYPASMTEAQCNNFKSIWLSFYEKYFIGDNSNVITMSESLAPYTYYAKKEGAKANVVTIDVGGETTDVFVVENHEPQLLSSFRFASNAIFGDGYNWDADNNGFVKLFRTEIYESLSRNGLSDFKDALEAIEKRKISGDIMAFFFALSQNQQIKEKNITSLDFLDKLSSNEQLKYVFILFYSAIIYNVANLMKAKGLEMPLTIAFSGNGSKTLRVLSPDKSTLTKFARLIFESVYDQQYDKNNDLEMIYNYQNPKEVTCKGGILGPNPQDFDSISNLKSALLGIDLKTLTDKQLISSFNDEVIKKIVAQTEAFIDFVFTLHSKNDSFFTKKLGADGRIINEIRSICARNLIEYAKLGLSSRKEELASWGADEKIEETLFFLPLVGMLNNLAREISKMKKE